MCKIKFKLLLLKSSLWVSLVPAVLTFAASNPTNKKVCDEGYDAAERAARRAAMIAFAKTQIAAREHDASAKVSTEAELAEQFGLVPSTASKYIGSDLTAEERAVRRKAGYETRSQKVSDAAKRKTGGKREELIALARAELAAHEKDPTTVISYAQELADKVGGEVSRANAQSWLASDLNADELAVRTAETVKRLNGSRAEPMADIRKTILEKVKEEIAAHRLNPSVRLSSNAELGRPNSLSSRAVSRWIADSIPGADVQYRDTALRRRGQVTRLAQVHERRIPLRARVVQQVRRELGEIEAGLRLGPSTNEELGKQHGVSDTTIDRFLRGLTREERRARNVASSLAGRRERMEQMAATRQRLIDKVKAEIAAHRADPSRVFTSNSDLGKEFGFEGRSTVSVILTAIPKADRTYRALAIRALSTPHYQKLKEEVISLVEGELEQFRLDASYQFLTTEQIASMLGVEDMTVRRWIKENFTDEDRATRLEAIRLQGIQRAHATRRESSIEWKGRKYDSYMEAAIADLMEKYMPGLQFQEGRNLHRRIGKLQYDFVVGKMVIEFHPPVPIYPNGDIDTEDEYRHFIERLASVARPERRAVREEFGRTLLSRYAARRGENFKESEDANNDLVVVGDAASLFTEVLQKGPLPTADLPPDAETFRREFNILVKTIRRENLGI